MSVVSNGWLRFAVAGLAAVAAVGVAASPASAVQTKTLTYKCKYPLIGTNPLSVKFEFDFPTSWPAGVPQPPFGIKLTATASGNTVPGLELVEGLAVLEGTATIRSLISVFGGGTPIVVNVPVPIPKYALPSPLPNPLVLTGAGSTPSLTIDDQGSSSIALEKLALNLIARDAAGQPIILPPVSKDIDGNPVTDSDGNPQTFDVYCKLDAGQSTTIPGPGPGPCDCPPNKPTGLAGIPSKTSVQLSWSALTDDGMNVVGYDVYQGSTRVASVTGTSATVSGLAPDTTYSFSVVAKRAGGSESARSDALTVRTLQGDVCVCLPFGVTGTSTATSVMLNWPNSSEPGIVGYDVLQGTSLVTATTSTSVTISGLTPGTSYTFTVRGRDASGQTLVGSSVTLPTKPAPVPPPTIKYGYNLVGSARLKNLTTGTLPLRGSIDAELTVSTGAYTADLALAQTQGRLTALGFLPVTAKIGFVPSGKTTGKLQDGVLTSSSLVRIKVQEVKLFGAIPLAGGNSCQTKSLSKIDLTSTDAEFVPTVGGTLAGTFAISDLNGCGALNGLVSPLTAGGGNSINAVLTPKA